MNSITKQSSAFQKVPSAVLLGLVFCLALLVRLVFVYANDFLIDSDEAIVGLMAKHIVEKASVPVFYYGQHYMGSLEAVFVSLIYLITGVSSLALKIVPLVFSLLLVWATYELGRSAAGKRAGLIAALLMALPPSTMVDWSTKSRGGFVEVILLGVVALLLCRKWCETRKPVTLFLVGLVLGCGWWVNNQIIFFMLPVGYVVFVRSFNRHIFNRFIVGMSGFLIGGWPYWAYNLTHDFVSFRMFGGTTDVVANIEGLFRSALPIILGARRIWHSEDIVPGLSWLVYLLYGAIFVRGLLKSRMRRSVVIQLCLLTVLACVSVFSLSQFGNLSLAPRYLLPLYPVLFVLVGAFLADSSLLSSVLLAGIVSVQLLSNYFGGVYIPGTPFADEGERVSRDHSELISWLSEQDVRFAYTNYWIGYRLALETNENVRPLLFGRPYQVRIPEYETAGSVISEQKVPYILTPVVGNMIRDYFDALGIEYSSTTLSDYVVLFNVRRSPWNYRELPLSSFDVSTSHHPESLAKALDSDETTRWGSAIPQNPEMWIKASFPSDQVQAMSLSVGRWRTDWARALEITCVQASGQQTPVLSAQTYETHLKFFPDLPLMVHFPGEGCVHVKLNQTGQDVFFDWSVAELSFFTGEEPD